MESLEFLVCITRKLKVREQLKAGVPCYTFICRLLYKSATIFRKQEFWIFCQILSELLPLPYDELAHYPLPLIYFARDRDTNMVRRIIITHRVGIPLAELLIEEGVPLETPLTYKMTIAEILQRKKLTLTPISQE